MYSNKAIKSIISFLGLQLVFSMASGCEKDEDKLLKKENLGWFKRNFISLKNPLSKTRILPPHNVQYHQPITYLPTEVNLHVISFVSSLSQTLSLKYSCKYFYNLIDDRLLHSKIPVEYISLFPENTAPVDIALGCLIYNKGLKSNNKKLLKKAATLHHKDALDWFYKREQSKIVYKQLKQTAVGGYAIGFGGGIVSNNSKR